MPSHDGQYGSSRGSDPGSVPAVVPQDWNLSRRVGIFHLAAPDGGKRRPDAVAQEGTAGGSARREHRDGGRSAKEGTGRGRPAFGGIYRPDAVATIDRVSASGLQNDFFAARC